MLWELQPNQASPSRNCSITKFSCYIVGTFYYYKQVLIEVQIVFSAVARIAHAIMILIASHQHLAKIHKIIGINSGSLGPGLSFYKVLETLRKF